MNEAVHSALNLYLLFGDEEYKQRQFNILLSQSLLAFWGRNGHAAPIQSFASFADKAAHSALTCFLGTRRPSSANSIRHIRPHIFIKYYNHKILFSYLQNLQSPYTGHPKKITIKIIKHHIRTSRALENLNMYLQNERLPPRVRRGPFIDFENPLKWRGVARRLQHWPLHIVYGYWFKRALDHNARSLRFVAGWCCCCWLVEIYIIGAHFHRAIQQIWRLPNAPPLYKIWNKFEANREHVGSSRSARAKPIARAIEIPRKQPNTNWISFVCVRSLLVSSHIISKTIKH